MKKKVLELREEDLTKLECYLNKLTMFLLDDYYASDDFHFFEEQEEVQKLKRLILSSIDKY